MKKGIIIGIVIGMLISGLGVYAAVSLSSDKISYKDTTVDAALDNLFDESVNGKTKIAEAITNKGIETLNTDSYDTIVSNINNISTGNPNLKYDEESGYIQVIDIDGNWHNLKYVQNIPIQNGIIYQNGTSFVEFDNSGTYRIDGSYTSSYGFVFYSDHIESNPSSNRSTITNEKYDISGFNKLYVDCSFNNSQTIIEIDISNVSVSEAYIYLANYVTSNGYLRMVGVTSQKDKMQSMSLANWFEYKTGIWTINKIWLD